MKIGITGDTHGDIKSIRFLLQVCKPVDYWFHTGDYSQDAKKLVEENKLPLLVVAGNNDKKEGRAKIDEFINLEGYDIWLTHGHRYLGNYDINELVWWGKKFEVNIIVFGHTHVPFVKWIDNILLINPGSLAFPRQNCEATYAVLNLGKDRKPYVELYNLGQNFAINETKM